MHTGWNKAAQLQHLLAFAPELRGLVPAYELRATGIRASNQFLDQRWIFQDRRWPAAVVEYL